MIRAYRILRRLVRKAVKPVCLWINACRFQEVEHEVSRLEMARQDAIRLMQAQRLRQVKLQRQRNQIAGW